MLRFILGVFTVSTVLATAGHVVAGVYQFIWSELSIQAPRRTAAWERWLRRARTHGAML
jgi:hypothetical protein